MLGFALQKGNPDSGGSQLSSQEKEMVGRERVLFERNTPRVSEAEPSIRWERRTGRREGVKNTVKTEVG